MKGRRVGYSTKLEGMVDALTGRWRDLDKIRMFGGICYLLKGNMCFGIYKDFLIVRLGAEGAAEKMRHRHVLPFDITGRPMKGWVMVAPGGWGKESSLERWLGEGKKFALGLPPKG